MTEGDKVTFTKEYILHILSEFDEVLRELNWKIHRPGVKPLIRSNLKEELIDIFKYWLTIVTLWGFNDDELFDEFWRKSMVVVQRFDQEAALSKAVWQGRRIAIIDIDGVLADYPRSFVAYVQDRLGRPLSHSGEDYSNLIDGLSQIDVARWKQKYREQGFEGEHVAVTHDARAYLEALRTDGYFICVVTARPYWQYKRMFGDTLKWFEKHGLPFDSIHFTEEKQAFALRLLDQGANIAFAIEDHGGQARSLAALGVRVFLLTRPYNKEDTFGPLPVTRACCLSEALMLLHKKEGER
jgi:uncharacterized HAD superfamily protein